MLSKNVTRFDERNTQTLYQKIIEIIEAIERVVVGKKGAIEAGLICLLTQGHLLIEDVPGVGKTLLAKAFGRVLGLKFTRVQFTPDLLPADITGTAIFNPGTANFEFKPGPVFTDIFLADEINRATPRTQSSLLESMGERQVSVDGKTHPLSPLFFVIATQNPIESQGTYPLPEAQLDRFMMKIDMGYPQPLQEIAILMAQMQGEAIEHLTPRIYTEEILAIQRLVTQVHIARSMLSYIIEIVALTRKHKHLLQGASPRGSLALMKSAQALAFLSGSDYVKPHYIKRLAVPILAHRLICKPDVQFSSVTAASIIEEILEQVKVPTG